MFSSKILNLFFFLIFTISSTITTSQVLEETEAKNNSLFKFIFHKNVISEASKENDLQSIYKKSKMMGKSYSVKDEVGSLAGRIEYEANSVFQAIIEDNTKYTSADKYSYSFLNTNNNKKPSKFFGSKERIVLDQDNEAELIVLKEITSFSENLQANFLPCDVKISDKNYIAICENKINVWLEESKLTEPSLPIYTKCDIFSFNNELELRNPIIRFFSDIEYKVKIKNTDPEAYFHCSVIYY